MTKLTIEGLQNIEYVTNEDGDVGYVFGVSSPKVFVRFDHYDMMYDITKDTLNIQKWR